MGRRSRVLLVAVALAAGAAAPAPACTTFLLRAPGLLLYGKNYDWSLGEGVLTVNPRGQQRTAVVDQGVTAARWTARYGSVTFNQYGLASPSGGMNEAGLVVELMWLDQTRYPAPDSRPAIGNLEWIQYQLDRHASVAEVIASDPEVRIDDRAPLHFLVADASGGVAVVEFLEGRMVARSGAEVPVPALANDAYADALASRSGGRGGSSSAARFARAGRRALSFHGAPTRAEAIDYAFATLADVAQRGATQWSIVYDIGTREVFYRTRGRTGVRHLALAGLDLSCAGGTRAVSLDASGPEILSSLTPLTAEENVDHLASAYRQTSFLARVPRQRLEVLGRQPFAAACGADLDATPPK
jgi:choloylglycine hydrolase